MTAGCTSYSWLLLYINAPKNKMCVCVCVCFHHFQPVDRPLVARVQHIARPQLVLSSVVGRPTTPKQHWVFNRTKSTLGFIWFVDSYFFFSSFFILLLFLSLIFIFGINATYFIGDRIGMYAWGYGWQCGYKCNICTKGNPGDRCMHTKFINIYEKRTNFCCCRNTYFLWRSV